MAKRIPTVGIIGLGFGRAHIPAFQANGAEVVAVCQRDQATARAVADKYACRGSSRSGRTCWPRPIPRSS
jgi:predicted dehydrogenase